MLHSTPAQVAPNVFATPKKRSKKDRLVVFGFYPTREWYNHTLATISRQLDTGARVRSYSPGPASTNRLIRLTAGWSAEIEKSNLHTGAVLVVMSPQGGAQ